MESDPAETRNAVAEHPDVVDQMGRTMKAILERGRSTDGKPQPYHDKTPWPQADWRKEFLG